VTDEEALTLKPGDVVRGKDGVLLVVVGVWHEGDPRTYLMRRRQPWARVRRLGRHPRTGYRYPNKDRTLAELDLVRHYETATANVYADWLDEHGEPMAAHKLRQAFPIDPGKAEGG
jgi:hypothetical protein